MFPTLPAQFESVEKGPQTWGNLKVSCLISALGTAQKAQTHGQPFGAALHRNISTLQYLLLVWHSVYIPESLPISYTYRSWQVIEEFRQIESMPLLLAFDVTQPVISYEIYLYFNAEISYVSEAQECE